jgi:hypothetical protein
MTPRPMDRRRWTLLAIAVTIAGGMLALGVTVSAIWFVFAIMPLLVATAAVFGDYRDELSRP